MVIVAQLVRAPDCGSGGRGFESHQSPNKGQSNFALAFFFIPQPSIFLSENDLLSVIRELFESIEQGDLVFVQKYLKAGWPVFVRNEGGSTPLHEAIYEGQEDIVRLLLAHKAEINAQDAFGNLPLQIAGIYSEASLIQILLDHGASIDEVSRQRTFTPLMLALNHRRVEVAQYLIEAGADIHFVEPDEGWTPLLIACEQQLCELAIFLIRQGVDLTACLTAGDTRGRNALELASYHGEEKLVKALLDAGMDVNHQPEGVGLTALHWAVYNGYTSLVRTLLAYGANPNLPAGGPYDKRTPLHFAASAGRADLVAMLLEHGSDPVVSDAEGRTPLQLALKHTTNSLTREAYAHTVELLKR
jgi:ankyrin repeat protein